MARASLGTVTKELARRQLAAKEARKIALMQKRYGPNWMTEMNSEQVCGPKELKELFELIDEDGSGLLDRAELAVLADFFGKIPLTEEQIDEAMAEMDEDGSGEVDYDEFRVWFEGKDARERAKLEIQREAQVCPVALAA
jgi:hypothetical protein